MSSAHQTDVLIIGGGLAGGTAALMLAQAGIRTTLLMKGSGFSATNSDKAQGGVAVLGEEEEDGIFIRDILESGDQIGYPPAIEHLVRQSREAVFEILVDRLQVPFSKDGDHFDMAQEGAHSSRRILNVRDMTGQAIQECMARALSALPHLTILTRHSAVDLLTVPHHSTNPLRAYQPQTCHGAYVLNHDTGQVLPFFARKVILATGGLGGIFLHTTNPQDAVGNGLAMAHRAGARLANLEYIQFHPTALFHKDSERFLISEAVRGEGARLQNRSGECFMQRYSPQGDLAPRDEVARAIYEEMILRGDDYVLLNLHEHTGVNIPERFPKIHRTCLKYGIDITRQAIPVVPAAHYSCGGVVSDLDGQTSMPNLYCVGEASATGVHGANRLASVSLLEALVWGRSAAAHIQKTLSSSDPLDPAWVSETPPWRYPDPQEDPDPALIWQDLVMVRYTMWNYSGIIRTRRRLERAHADLEYLHHRILKFYRTTRITPQIIDLRDAVQTALLVVHAALHNPVSRGAHFIKAGAGTDG